MKKNLNIKIISFSILLSLFFTNNVLADLVPYDPKENVVRIIMDNTYTYKEGIISGALVLILIVICFAVLCKMRKK